MGTCFSYVDKTLTQTLPQFSENAEKTSPRKKTLIPIADQSHLLDLSLCEVSVMSSHNSYIRTLQHFGESSTDAIQIALNRGARMLELDVYRDREGVFVAHGKEGTPNDIITTTRLELGVALEFISRKAFANTNDPLFIALELLVHNEEPACNQIADLLTLHLGSRLYTGKLTGETKLRELVGKVVLFSGGGSVGRLASMIHTQWSDIFQNVSSDTAPDLLRGKGTCIRVYPAGNLLGALSANFNPVNYLLHGATFVALNVCMTDEHMATYISWFAQSSFMKKVERGEITS
jgi:hypothetical protein